MKGWLAVWCDPSEPEVETSIRGVVVESRPPNSHFDGLVWFHRGSVCWTLIAEIAIDVIAGRIPVEL
jgi:hypothetical protein